VAAIGRKHRNDAGGHYRRLMASLKQRIAKLIDQRLDGRRVE
jgi:hypothetical protein